ncbi:aspartate racemase/maleate isomerase family protein [Mesorhizobium sp. BHbdii]
MQGIGMIVLSTDPVAEGAYKSEMKSADARIFTTRVSYDLQNHREGGFIPIPDWKTVTDTLPPGDLVDIIVFTCTSATMALGNDVLVRQLSEARPGLKYSSPGIASVAMMQRYGLRRIALLSPYGPKLHNAFTPYFAAHGIEVVQSYSLNAALNIKSDDDISRIPMDRIESELKRLLARSDQIDALFVSCAAVSITQTDLVRISARLGLPVLASIPATAWHSLDLLGDTQRRDAMASALGLAPIGKEVVG